MKIPNTLVYLTLFSGSFGLGAYNGYNSYQGINPLALSGIPIASSGIAAIEGATAYSKEPGDFEKLRTSIGFIEGVAVGGLGAIIFESTGFATGFVLRNLL